MVTKKLNRAGFAVVEAVLAVVVIGLVVGVGYWVVKRHDAKTSTASSNAAQPASSSTATVDPGKVGTTTGIDQATAADAKDEEQINKKFASTEQTTATSSASAQSNLGDAYNETNL